MNKTHRIVWSAARQAYIVAHEHATACGKPASTRAAAVLVAGLLAAAPALASNSDLACASSYVVTGSTTGTCYVGSKPLGGTDTNIIVNAGASIDATQNSVTGDAILVENGSSSPEVITLVGKIDNKGTLIAGLGGFPYDAYDTSAGIKVRGNVAVSGGIIHRGTINSTTAPDDDKSRHGIAIVSGGQSPDRAVNPDSNLGSPVIEGAVKVEVGGVIHAWNGGNGIRVQGDSLDKGQLHIKGGIDNAGTITARNSEPDADGNIIYGTGIGIEDSTVGNGIVNTGTITAGGNGIGVFRSHVKGNIDNQNIIEAEGQGIFIGGSTVDGTLRNSGTINAQGSAIYIIDNSALGQGLVNTVSGALSSGSDVVFIEGAIITGDILNAGSITSTNLDGFDINRLTLIGNLDNQNTIQAADEGIELEDSDIRGNILNSGSIVAGRDGIRLTTDGGEMKVSGDIRNEGAIVAGDSGYEIDDLTLAGSFVNAGSIVAVGDGIHIDDSTIEGGLINSGRIDAQEQAVVIHDVEIGGDIRNDGIIISGDSGYEIEGLTLTGNFVNAGGIVSAEGDGVSIGEESTIGKLINNGSIVAAEKAIALYEPSMVAGVTIAAAGNKPAVLDGKQFALFAQGTTQKNIWECSDEGVCGEVTVDVPAASFGGIALAGNTRIVGDIYAQADALTVTGSDNRISGAFDVKQLTVESGGVLVLDSLASSSKTWQPPAPEPGVREVEESGPILADALKTSDGIVNNGRLVLAKAEAYKVIGNYSQAADATLAVRATGDDSYSKLLVDGTATLASGSKIAVDVRQDSEIDAGATSSNTLFNTNRLAGVIQATNLVSDGKFTVSDNSALFDFSGEKTGNNVDLVLKRAQGDKKPVYLEQIVKDNKGSIPLASQDAARVLDKITDRLVAGGGAGAMAPVIDALGRLGTNTELAQAVEQLTPALPSAALSAVSDSLGAINRVVQARVEGNIGLSSGDEPSAERYVWVKPFGSYAKQDARSETAGFKANTGGLVFGADAAISPKLRLGAALAYAHSDVDGKSASAPQSSKVDVYQLIGYGSVQLDGNTEFNFQLDGGRNRNQGERQLSFMGVKANSDYDSLSYHMGAGIGRTFALPREITTTPSLRLDYTRIKEDGYSETGAGAANLINGKRSVEQTLLAVDNRVTLPLNARQSLSLNAGAAYDLMNDGAVLTSAFAGESGALFSTEASGQSRWLWRAGIGHTYKADTGKGGLELSTRLDGEWRKGGYSNATASVKARYAF